VNQEKLTVLRNEVKPCRLRLDIEVPATRVKRCHDSVTGQFHTQARIPGFRPGKSPKKLVLRRFASEIAERTMEALIEETTKEALAQESIEPETAPRVQGQDRLTLDVDSSFVYSVEFDCAPSFELPNYKELKITLDGREVDDDAVDQVIGTWREQRAQFEKVDRPAGDGDLLKVSYHANLTDEQRGELPETAKFLVDADDTWLPIREPEILPGTIENLKGAAAGDEKTFQVVFPDSFMESSLREKSIEYNVKVHEVHGSELPEFDDELAKQFGAETADEARDMVRQGLESRERERRDNELRQSIAEALLEGMDFALPPSLVDRETYEIFRGMVEQEYRRNQGNVTEDTQKQLLAHAREGATRMLRRRYVLLKIADAEGIEVGRDELDGFIDNLSTAYRMSGKVLTRRLVENGRLPDIYFRIKEQKTMERLVELAEVVEAEAS